METTSDKYSFKGYKFKIWLKRNKDNIKLLVTASVGLAVFFLPQIQDAGTSAAVAGVAAILTKLLVDAVDYWISETPIETPPTPPKKPDEVVDSNHTAPYH